MSTIFIKRIVKDKDHPFVQADKEFLSEEKLSWRAKGILTYLLSKPDDWKLNIDYLVKRSTEGENAVRSVIDELILFGYIERIKSNAGKGQFLTEYFIYEIPKTQMNQEVQPRPKNPDVVNPNVESQDNTNNDSRFDIIKTHTNIKPNKKELVSYNIPESEEEYEEIVTETNEQTIGFILENIDYDILPIEVINMIKNTVFKLNTNELLAKQLDKPFKAIKSQLLLLNSAMVQRAVIKYDEANKRITITNHLIYFSKCLLSAIEEYGFYSINTPFTSKTKPLDNRNNFDQRTYSDEEYMNFYSNYRK